MARVVSLAYLMSSIGSITTARRMRCAIALQFLKRVPVQSAMVSHCQNLPVHGAGAGRCTQRWPPWRGVSRYVKRPRILHAMTPVGSAMTVNDENSTLKGLKVLVIDDSKTIRRTAETLLAKEGCEVFTAIDGFDALA